MNASFVLAVTLMTVGLQRPEDPFVPQNPPAKEQPANGLAGNAVARKEARDQVVRLLGKEALGFTRQYGDVGIFILQHVEPETGKKLVALHEAGVFERLKNVRAVLLAVRQAGEPAARWLIANHAQLEDPDQLEAWCRQPLEFAFDLKDLAQAAAQLREGRKLVLPWTGGTSLEINPGLLLVAGLLVLLLLAILVRRRPASPGP